MWNSCYKLSSLNNIEFSTAIVTVKHKLKTGGGAKYINVYPLHEKAKIYIYINIH